MFPARYRLSAALATLVLLVFPSIASAEEAAERPASAGKFAIELGVEYFRWQEYDDQDLRLLTEHGPRASIAAAVDNLARTDSGIILSSRLKGYIGAVDYDGQDSGRRFVATESDYHGWDFRLDGGYRFAELVGGAAGLDLFIGVGMEQWRRDIKGGINALGLPVQGLIEDYTLRYARIGLGLAYNQTPIQGYLTLGFRRPLSIDEDLVLGDTPLRLHPGKRISSFAAYKISLLPTAAGEPYGLYMKLFYENYRFTRSSAVNIGNLLVWQPRSHLDLFGVSFGYTF